MNSQTTMFEKICLALILGGIGAAFLGSYVSTTLALVGAGSAFLGAGLVIALRDGQMPALIFVFVGAGIIICTLMGVFMTDPSDAEWLSNLIVPVLILGIFGLFGVLLLWHALSILLGQSYGTISQLLGSLVFGLLLVGVSFVLIVGLLRGTIIAVPAD